MRKESTVHQLPEATMWELNARHDVAAEHIKARILLADFYDRADDDGNEGLAQRFVDAVLRMTLADIPVKTLQ